MGGASYNPGGAAEPPHLYDFIPIILYISLFEPPQILALHQLSFSSR